MSIPLLAIGIYGSHHYKHDQHSFYAYINCFPGRLLFGRERSWWWGRVEDAFFGWISLLNDNTLSYFIGSHTKLILNSSWHSWFLLTLLDSFLSKIPFYILIWKTIIMLPSYFISFFFILDFYFQNYGKLLEGFSKNVRTSSLKVVTGIPFLINQMDLSIIHISSSCLQKG